MSVFDEPEAGIDLWSFQNLIRVFERMQEKNKGGSIIVISHQERILDIADDSHIETMNAIVLRILHTAVIDSASRYNNDIRIFPDIKVIIDRDAESITAVCRIRSTMAFIVSMWEKARKSNM